MSCVSGRTKSVFCRKDSIEVPRARGTNPVVHWWPLEGSHVHLYVFLKGLKIRYRGAIDTPRVSVLILDRITELVRALPGCLYESLPPVSGPINEDGPPLEFL